jgi:hypothetical protein
MPIKATGPLSLNTDIIGEFGGTKPHSLSEYYKGGARVPNVTSNAKIPLSGNPISFSNFYNAANILIISYDIIGGGGGGGTGARDKQPYEGTFAPSGTITSLTGSGINIQAPGGAGGENSSRALRTSPWVGTAGGSSGLGTGGAAGREDGPGGNATGFGAGGGGGGGDSPNSGFFGIGGDKSGAGGRGGNAATRRTGSFEFALGTEIVYTITIGAAGGGDRRDHPGGNGSPGRAVISFNGNSYIFVGNGTLSIPSGAVSGGNIPPAIIPGNKPPPPPVTAPDRIDVSCFIAGTLVTMSDGSQRKIEEVVIGDKLLGKDDQVNTVIDYDYAKLAGRRLVGINNLGKFKTPEHPLYTKDGWKSYCPDTFSRDFPDMVHLNVTELRVGDSLLLIDGSWLDVNSIEVYENEPDQTVYNFILDGNHTYYANGILTHNRN